VAGSIFLLGAVLPVLDARGATRAPARE
jgi:hypothetical protein